LLQRRSSTTTAGRMRKVLANFLNRGAAPAAREWPSSAAKVASTQQSEASESDAAAEPMITTSTIYPEEILPPEKRFAKEAWANPPDAPADEKNDDLVNRLAQFPLPQIDRVAPPPPRANVSRSLPGENGAVSSILGREHEEISGRLNPAQLREMFELQTADPLKWGERELGEKFDVNPHTIRIIFRHCYTPT
jgi:hypothetical protein